MTREEGFKLYTWLQASWPTVLKPGLPEDFVTAKVDELQQAFGEYDFGEVLDAFNAYKAKNARFPFSKEIVDLILEARTQKGQTADNSAQLYEMEIIWPDGYEACVGLFTRPDFINHPRNVNHLQPEEWRRRFMATRHRYIIQQQIKNGQRKAGEV